MKGSLRAVELEKSYGRQEGRRQGFGQRRRGGDRRPVWAATGPARRPRSR